MISDSDGDAFHFSYVFCYTIEVPISVRGMLPVVM